MFLKFFLIICAISICVACKEKAIRTLKEPVLGMEFVQVPSGTFKMGATDPSMNSDLINEVTISREFWLGKTEVTQKHWQMIMGKEELHPEKPSPFRNTNPNYPIVSISYFDVEKFLIRLNSLSENYQFRLPTETEWEYACRSGTTTPFYFGSSIDSSLVNFNAEIPSNYSFIGTSPGHPVPVASYAPNAWGLFDMHGNVWEWVSDWYETYPEKGNSNPLGPETGKEKVIRGGSWYFGADFATSFSRRRHEPRLWGFSIGFRLVCEKKP